MLALNPRRSPIDRARPNRSRRLDLTRDRLKERGPALPVERRGKVENKGHIGVGRLGRALNILR